MIVIADISGIQNYLFDVADAGGGQTRPLGALSSFCDADTGAITLLWGVKLPLRYRTKELR
jgi:hypothetical protein